MIVAITGHRPNKLNNEYDLNGPISQYIKGEIERILDELKPDTLVTGMALGVDTLFALIGIERGLKITAAIPCHGHDSKWVPASKKLYAKILSNPLVTSYTVTEGPYSDTCMQDRNKYMVDNCDKLIAVYDGSSGGTGNCVNYAKKVGRDIIYIDPRKWKDNSEEECPF